MRLPATFVTKTIFVAVVALVSVTLLFAFHEIWRNYVQSTVLRADAKNEERLLVAAVVSSLGSVAIAVITAVAGMLDRSRVMAADRRKKGFELHAEAAFKMNKAVLTVYRLLQKAEAGGFKSADAKKVSLLFESAEEATLLLEGDIVSRFERLWTQAENISASLLKAGAPGEQNRVWTVAVKPYANGQAELIQALKASLG